MRINVQMITYACNIFKIIFPKKKFDEQLEKYLIYNYIIYVNKSGRIRHRSHIMKHIIIVFKLCVFL